MAKDKNNTGDNNNNRKQDDKNKKTKTTTNDEDDKKREARRRRFATPAILETEEDAGLNSLFDAPPPSAVSTSDATPRQTPAKQQEEETAMEEDDDSDFGIGSLYNNETPLNDDVLESDEQEVVDTSTTQQPRQPRPKYRTLRCYIIAEEGEVEYGVRKEWTPSKTSSGEAPLTVRDIGCQTRCGNDSLARRREMLKRHRANKRARLAAKFSSTTSTSAADIPAGGAINHPQKRSRQTPTQQEDLRAKLKQRQQVNHPPKRARIDARLPKSSSKEAQKARDFYKARHDGSSKGQQKKQRPRQSPLPPPPSSRKRSRPSSPQPSTSSGISNQLPKSFVEKMRESLVSALNLELQRYEGASDRRRRSPSPRNDKDSKKDEGKDKGKGKGKGKGRRD